MENEEIIKGSTQAEPEPDLNPVNVDANKTASESGQVVNTGLKSFLRGVAIFLGTVLFILAIVFFILYFVPVLKERLPGQKAQIAKTTELKNSADFKKRLSLLNKDIQRFTLKSNGYTSGQSYIVVNTTENRFFLYTNKKLIREGFCSTGSLMMLKTEKGKVWVFKTPRGKRQIQGKIANPSWKRPDWSFIEEGLPVPPKDDPSRWESGVLGDYALGIGDGYLIHGTIYKRFLGMPVTHGCVRLNDEDLKVIFNTLNIGSKVYIF
jgi:lipoprotein-anchoring transpeptidase ErfK/SrfK